MTVLIAAQPASARAPRFGLARALCEGIAGQWWSGASFGRVKQGEQLGVRRGSAAVPDPEAGEQEHQSRTDENRRDCCVPGVILPILP